jgi:hypothetical protein
MIHVDAELRVAAALDAALDDWRSASGPHVPGEWRDGGGETGELVRVADILHRGAAGRPRPDFALELERAVRLAVPQPARLAAPERAVPPVRGRLIELMAAGSLAAALAVVAVLFTGPRMSPGAVPTARAATGTATPAAQESTARPGTERETAQPVALAGTPPSAPR